MSSTCSAALADSASGLSEPECGLSPSAKSIPIAETFSRKHWPDVPIFGDVRTHRSRRWLMADANERYEHAKGNYAKAEGLGDSIDVICGGFPCQDISVAGKGAGIDGDRTGLWTEYARLIGELRPRYVIVENVAALLGRGLDRVLGDLAALGYDAEWHCIPASAVGAPQGEIGSGLWPTIDSPRLRGVRSAHDRQVMRRRMLARRERLPAIMRLIPGD